MVLGSCGCGLIERPIESEVEALDVGKNVRALARRLLIECMERGNPYTMSFGQLSVLNRFKSDSCYPGLTSQRGRPEETGTKPKCYISAERPERIGTLFTPLRRAVVRATLSFALI